MPVRLLPRRGRHPWLARLEPDSHAGADPDDNLHAVGTYAIAPEWGDGHHTGFYTFARLREECPCPEDTERRARDKTAHTEHDEGGRSGWASPRDPTIPHMLTRARGNAIVQPKCLGYRTRSFHMHEPRAFGP